MSLFDPLFSEISLLHACNQLCSRIVSQLGARDRVPTAHMFTLNTEAAYREVARRSDILGFLHSNPTALSYPAHIAASQLPIITMRPKVNTMGHDYGAGSRTFPVPFPFSEEVNVRVRCDLQHTTKSAFQHMSSALSDRSFSPAGQQNMCQRSAPRLETNAGDGLTDKINKKRKGIPYCMIHSCQSLSEPCKRKLKLCSEHKRAAQVQLYKDGPFQRYCRYCHVLHDLDAFPKEDVRTICVR
mmetsp:Transcript_2987/g.6782  ORF Transcript_2987/g.6782 Transcript_2987/m.6782 type:complete len:242 (-) Transcript_2987:3790-4515(-)